MANSSLRIGGLQVSVAAFLPLLALAMRVLSTPTANASFVLLAAYALIGSAHAIRAIALCWAFTMLNPGLVADATAVAAGRYLIFGAAAVSVMLRSHTLSNGLRVRRVTLTTFLLGAFLMAHSALFSPMVDVSFLKALSWTLAMCTLISAWLQLNDRRRASLEKEIFGGLTILMVGSVPLVWMPVGYLRNGTGFQGLLSHPQAFGPVMALLGAWATSRMLAQSRPPWTAMCIVLGSLVLTILSEARTAGLSMVLGVMAGTVLAPGLSGDRISLVLPGLRSPRLLLIVAVAAAGIALAADKVSDVVANYITKSGRADVTNVFEAYENSRGGLADTMWDNIKQDPVVGIGFGIASDQQEMYVERDPIFGVPTSAVIEKGVLPLAVWEEIGVMGLFVVSLWLAQLLITGARAGVGPVSVGVTALLLNMGEATLFSPGGMGLITLVLVAWVFAAGHQRRS